MVYRRRKRRRRRKRQKLSKGRARNRRMIRSLMLQPKTVLDYNTGDYDSASYNTHLLIPGSQTPKVGIPSDNKNDAISAMSEFANQESLKGNRFIIGSQTEKLSLTNTKNAPCEFQMWKLTPRVCITKELFDEYSLGSLYQMPELVDALAADDVLDYSQFGLNVMQSKMVQKYFKTLKKKKFCLEPGAQVDVHLKGLPYRFLSGDELHDNSNMIARPMSCQFWYIRVTGRMVHDTTDDGLVGTGPVHLDYIRTVRSTFYKIPSDIREETASVSLDTIASAEAIVDADHVAAVVAEQ